MKGADGVPAVNAGDQGGHTELTSSKRPQHFGDTEPQLGIERQTPRKKAGPSAGAAGQRALLSVGLAWAWVHRVEESGVPRKEMKLKAATLSSPDTQPCCQARLSVSIRGLITNVVRGPYPNRTVAY